MVRARVQVMAATAMVILLTFAVAMWGTPPPLKAGGDMLRFKEDPCASSQCHKLAVCVRTDSIPTGAYCQCRWPWKGDGIYCGDTYNPESPSKSVVVKVTSPLQLGIPMMALAMWSGFDKDSNCTVSWSLAGHRISEQAVVDQSEKSILVHNLARSSGEHSIDVVVHCGNAKASASAQVDVVSGHGHPKHARSEVRLLTPSEKSAFTDAVRTLKEHGVYDLFVDWHVLVANTPSPASDYASTSRNIAHKGPAFLTWHRLYILMFENALRMVDTNAFLPFWDWTRDWREPLSSPVWGDDMMGSASDKDGVVITGPFAQGVWIPRHNPPLKRQFGLCDWRTVFGSGPCALPTATDVWRASMETTYDTPPYDITSSGFRNHIEGWVGEGGIHNAVHRWIGGFQGHMAQDYSPDDPVFFLHHANIDRIFFNWQRSGKGHSNYHTLYRPVAQSQQRNTTDTYENDPLNPDKCDSFTRQAQTNLSDCLSKEDFGIDSLPPECLHECGSPLFIGGTVPKEKMHCYERCVCPSNSQILSEDGVDYPDNCEAPYGHNLGDVLVPWKEGDRGPTNEDVMDVESLPYTYRV